MRLPWLYQRVPTLQLLCGRVTRVVVGHTPPPPPAIDALALRHCLATTGVIVATIPVDKSR